LVERRPCNWVVVFAGWMLSLLSGNDSIVLPKSVANFSQKWERGLEHAMKDYVFCLTRKFQERTISSKKQIVSSRHRKDKMGAWLDLRIDRTWPVVGVGGSTRVVHRCTP
jgi:hypothetical protein